VDLVFTFPLSAEVQRKGLFLDQTGSEQCFDKRRSSLNTKICKFTGHKRLVSAQSQESVHWLLEVSLTLNEEEFEIIDAMVVVDANLIRPLSARYSNLVVFTIRVLCSNFLASITLSRIKSVTRACFAVQAFDGEPVRRCVKDDIHCFFLGAHLELPSPEVARSVSNQTPIQIGSFTVISSI